MTPPWSSNVDTVVIVGSFAISSNELVSIVVRLLYPRILDRSVIAWRYLSSFCLMMSVLQSVLFLMSCGMLLKRFGCVFNSYCYLTLIHGIYNIL